MWCWARTACGHQLAHLIFFAAVVLVTLNDLHRLGSRSPQTTVSSGRNYIANGSFVGNVAPFSHEY